MSLNSIPADGQDFNLVSASCLSEGFFSLMQFPVFEISTAEANSDSWEDNELTCLTLKKHLVVSSGYLELFVFKKKKKSVKELLLLCRFSD